jgi:hypothetical protein
MTQETALRKIIQEKGWLAIREILFDNAVTARPANCDGLITMDADTVYWVYSTSPSEYEDWNKHLLLGKSREFSTFKQLKVKGLDHVQGFDITINTSIVDMDEDPARLKVHNYVGAQVYKTYLHGKGNPVLRPVNDYVPAANEIVDVNGCVLSYDSSQAIELGDDTAMFKETLDRFNTNHTKFKATIASLFGIDVGTLL